MHLYLSNQAFFSLSVSKEKVISLCLWTLMRKWWRYCVHINVYPFQICFASGKHLISVHHFVDEGFPIKKQNKTTYQWHFSIKTESLLFFCKSLKGHAASYINQSKTITVASYSNESEIRWYFKWGQLSTSDSVWGFVDLSGLFTHRSEQEHQQFTWWGLKQATAY